MKYFAQTRHRRIRYHKRWRTGFGVRERLCVHKTLLWPRVHVPAGLSEPYSSTRSKIFDKTLVFRRHFG